MDVCKHRIEPSTGTEFFMTLHISSSRLVAISLSLHPLVGEDLDTEPEYCNVPQKPRPNPWSVCQIGIQLRHGQHSILFSSGYVGIHLQSQLLENLKQEDHLNPGFHGRLDKIVTLSQRNVPLFSCVTTIY